MCTRPPETLNMFILGVKADGVEIGLLCIVNVSVFLFPILPVQDNGDRVF